VDEALRVVVESATLANDNGGFVVVYDADSFDEIDRPQDRIGTSELLPEGTTENIEIEVKDKNLVANDRFTAVVVNDTNGNGGYNPGVDMGALNDNGMAVRVARSSK
jgi:hypothetical protein